MVTWADDGFLSGYVLTDDGEAIWSAEGYRYASPGTVDVQAITRLQYPVAVPSGTDPFQPPSVRVTAPFTFSAGDVTTADGRLMTATMFFAPASDFADGVKPLPAAIIAAPNLRVFRAAQSRTTAGTTTYNIPGPTAGSLSPNQKYWVLFAPTFVDSGSTPSRTNDTPVGNVNTLGRALSMWTNRTPPAPTILSPVSDLIVSAGSTIQLKFANNDPDRLPWDSAGGLAPPNPYKHEDIAGLQFQYSARPTSVDPNPPWIDLPVTEYAPDGDVPAVRDGWILALSSATDSSTLDPVRYTKTLKVVCGADTLVRQTGVLPSGNWRLRMRQFDYGHPLTRLNLSGVDGLGYGPLGVVVPGYTTSTGGNPGVDNDYTPDTYPSANKSPWSAIVNVTVTEQVPASVPISPANNIAITQGETVTLNYEYRNTHLPPYPQAKRLIQMRQVGQPWSTLVSENSASTTFDIPPTGVTNITYDECDSAVGWTKVGPGGTVPSVVAGRLQLDGWPAGTGYLQRNGGSGARPSVYISGRRQNNPQVGQASVRAEFYDEANALVPATQITAANTGATVSATLTDWTTRYDVSAPFAYMRIIHTYAAGGTILLEVDRVIIESPPYILTAPHQYQWRVQVTDSTGKVSPFSAPASFWLVPAPASGQVRPIPSGTIDGATLGCGEYRVLIYRRGGKRYVGELTHVSEGDWSRVRDDLSDAKVVITGYDTDCGKLLSQLQSWAYEVVLIRDNGFSRDRVWEGPITLLTYEQNKVTIHAKDVMVYAYRRIIKQIINDTGTSPTAGRSVVARATQVVQNAFAPDDPNVLAYMKVIAHDDDAKQYRNLPPYSRTAFEEVDDMAANAGLDYTTAGRSIILWGTKHRIGTLPEFRDKDLGATPIVSEYGMSFANFYSVSDGNGVHGDADRLDEFGQDDTYGHVEMLSSTWASESAEETGTYTQEGIETLSKSFAEHAERSIADRYPPPVIVRVPDNTTIQPSTVLSIQQLVPGVVVPLRSTATLRKVVANQKLDSVKVTWKPGKETIAVTLSPFNRDDDEIVEGE